MKKGALVVLVVLVAGAVAGCADASADDAPATGAAGVSSAEAAAVEDDAATPAPDARTDPETEDDAADAGDPRTCLLDTWVANNAFFLASIREFGDEVRAVDGTVTITFAADGTTVTDYQDWVITAVVEGQEVQLTRSGVDAGTFTATESALTLVDTQIGSTLSMTLAGMQMSIDPAPVDYTNVEYVCSASDARIITPDGTLELSRR